MTKYTEENSAIAKPAREKRPILPVIITILLVAVLGIQFFLLYTNIKVNGYVAEQQRKEAEELQQESTYQEDGYKVGDEYEIKSTKDISDAYISGDDSALSDEDKDTLQMAKKVVDEVITDGMSNYEKEEAIYRWMVKNIGQGASTTVSLPGQGGGDQYTPHGVLSGNGAVCVGYATTFRLFMNMLGMDCHIVHNEYHSWDLVQLDDGEWYHTDVYSDATEGSSEPSYYNFNMTDSSARNGHDWDGSALPEAKGVKYTAANQKKKDIKALVDVPADLKQGFDAGERVFFYQFDKVTEDDYPVADYIVSQLQSAFSASGSEAYISGSWFENEDESRGYILGLNVSVYDSSMSEGAQSLSEDRQQELTDAINAAFGTEIGTDPYAYDYGMEGDTYDETTYTVEDEMGTVKKDGQEITTDYIPEEQITEADGEIADDYHYYADEDGE